MNGLIPSLVANHKICLVLGPGGVGKTTQSVLIALTAAFMGKRVALLSIDPAKRLADSMGLSLNGELSEVNLKQFGAKGQLFAAMLDQKSVFDQMVADYSPAIKIRDSIYQNKLYQAASKNFSGPLEYMALAKLDQITRNDKFDTVIVDTPPDTHALDFLERPNVLAGFQENKVLKLLVKPFHFAGKMGAFGLNLGEKVMGSLARITGTEALSSLAEFLVLIQEVIGGFSEASKRITKLISGEDAAIVIVSRPQSNSDISSQYILDQLSKLGLKPKLFIVNRCFGLDDIRSLDNLSSLDPINLRLKMESHFAERVSLRGQKIGCKTLLLKERQEEIHNLDSLVAIMQEISKPT